MVCPSRAKPNTWKRQQCLPFIMHSARWAVLWRECPPPTLPSPLSSPPTPTISLHGAHLVISMFGWWEKGGMFLRFICSSSEVCNSQPCTTMPGFNKDSEPGSCIALQEVLFPPWPYSFSPSPWHACHWGAWKQIHALGREGEFGGRFETLPPTSHSCWKRASRLLSAHGALFPAEEWPGGAVGTCPVGVGLKEEVLADLGSRWQELRTVAGGWLGTGASGIPFMARSVRFWLTEC